MTQFKAGDRVRVYFSRKKLIGKVVDYDVDEIPDDGCLKIDFKEHYGHSLYGIFHQKQCSLLKKETLETSKTELFSGMPAQEFEIMKMIQNLTSTCTSLVERIEKIESNQSDVSFIFEKIGTISHNHVKRIEALEENKKQDPTCKSVDYLNEKVDRLERAFIETNSNLLKYSDAYEFRLKDLEEQNEALQTIAVCQEGFEEKIKKLEQESAYHTQCICDLSGLYKDNEEKILALQTYAFSLPSSKTITTSMPLKSGSKNFKSMLLAIEDMYEATLKAAMRTPEFIGVEPAKGSFESVLPALINGKKITRKAWCGAWIKIDEDMHFYTKDFIETDWEVIEE